MIDFLKIMDRPIVAAVISALIGFGIAAMFRPLCKGPDCLVIRGPPVSELRNTVYQFGSKCVEFNTKAVECPAKDSGKQVVDAVSFAEVVQN